MKKITTLILLLVTFSLLTTGCGDGIYKGEKQKYYVADLVGDPNNRNILRATTVWSEDATFELLIPDYWEVKIDKDNKYNTDIYLTSDEYDEDACIVLPGTEGYGVTEDLIIEQWMTLIPWGAADDYYFYEQISDEERMPVMRVVQFTDADGNYYLFEMHFPQDGDYTGCHEDFSNMITTFTTLNTELEDTYIEEEIFQEKWTILAIKNKGSEEDRVVIDYPIGWTVEDDNGLDYLKNTEYGCEIHAGIEDKSASELEGLEEGVWVFDNNDMAKTYTWPDGSIYITVTHNEIVYNFIVKNVNEMCASETEAIVKSFRTYLEAQATIKGIEMVDLLEEETVVEEVQE